MSGGSSVVVTKGTMGLEAGRVARVWPRNTESWRPLWTEGRRSWDPVLPVMVYLRP